MSTLSATITADTSQFNSAVTKAKGELEKLTNVSKKQRSEFDKAVRTIDRVREGYIKGDQATRALNSSVSKLVQLHADLKRANNPLAESIMNVANAAAKEKANIDKVASSVNRLKSSSANSGNLFKGVGDSFKEFSSLASAFNSGGLVSALGSLAGPLSVVTAGFAGLNEVIKNNETLFDKWQGVLSGAGTAWTNFMRTFNFSTIGASFTAGQNFYNASDALESYRALNASFLGSILDDSQKAKTDKSEGKPWSKEQIGNLKKRINNYYDQEIKMIQETATAKKKTLLSGLKEGSLEQAIAKKFFTEFGEADNKYGVLEEYKEMLNRTRGELDRIEAKAQAEVVDEIGMSSSDEDYWIALEKRKNELKKKYKEKYALVKGLDFLVNSESDLNEFVKLLNDEKKSSQEQQRLIKEVNEAVVTPKKLEEVKKEINELHEENAKLKEEIGVAQTVLRGVGEVSAQDVDLNKLQENIKKVVENRKKMEDLYSTFESTPVNEYWRLVTDFDNAILKGPEEMETALRGLQNSVNEYVKKWAALGYSVENLWEMIEESREVSDIYGGSPLNVQPITYKDLKKGWDNYAQSKKNELGTKTLPKEDKIIESLQEQGIRPYKPFVFEDYKKEDYKKEDNKEIKDTKEQLGLELDAVNDLAAGWENLWSVIDTGNNTLNTVLSTMGSTASDIANLTKTLAANELAASQAVAMGKATASASGLPFPYNLVAIGTVVATMTSLFAKFASIGKFAEGGIVGGNSTIGDYNLARVNSGEMILNGTQQKRLFNMLNGEGGLSDENSGGQKVELVVRGQDLVGVLNNYTKKINKVR